jgi:glycosyltransferase involved in cell wall biosynthesis
MTRHQLGGNAVVRTYPNKSSGPVSSGIAVLIPMYDVSPAILSRTIRICTQQSVQAHIVIVDDGSPQPLAVEESSLPLTIIRLAQNSRIVGALNVGLEWILDNGFEYIARFDAGDDMDPARLERQREVLIKQSGIECLGTGAYFKKPSGETILRYTPPCGIEAIAKLIPVYNPFVHPSLMFRASAFRRHGLYSDEFTWAEDYELVYRMLRQGGYLENIPDPLVDYYIDPNSASESRRREQVAHRLRIMARYFRPNQAGCYYGIVRSCLIAAVPRQIGVRMRQFGQTTLPPTAGPFSS